METIREQEVQYFSRFLMKFQVNLQQILNAIVLSY